VKEFDFVIKAALKEDIGAGDVTTRFFVPLGTRFYGEMKAKDSGVVCGLGVVKRVFELAAPGSRVQVAIKEGSRIKKGDVLFVNTVKDRDYLEIAYAALRTGKIGKCIVAATDSMIDKLGADEIRKLVGFSDVYISNVDELERLTQTEITDNPSLARAMDKVRDMQLSGSRDGKKPHVYVTFGENGAAVMDTSGNVFYQPTMNFQSRGPLAPRIVNTNGCGDAFAGIAATLEASGFPTLEILDYANCAGQICTQHNGASGNFLATPEKISEFKKQYSSSPIKMYDRPQQDFIGGIIVNCRFD